MIFGLLYLLFGVLLFGGTIYGVTRLGEDDVELGYVLGFVLLSFFPGLNLVWFLVIVWEYWKYVKHKFPSWTFNPVIFRRKIK